MSILFQTYHEQTYLMSFEYSLNTILLVNLAMLFQFLGYMEYTLLACKVTIIHSVLYFLCDLIRFRERGAINFTKIIHHTICIYAGYKALMFSDEALYFSNIGILFHEISQPWWSLLRVLLDKKRFVDNGFPSHFDQYLTKRVLGINMIICFMCGRFVYWPIYVYFCWPSSVDSRYIYYVVLPLYILSSYWLYRMHVGVQKELNK